MGSFNVACSVSNISISPDMKVAYLPLKMSIEGLDNSVIKNRNFLIYPWCHYAPYTLPIFGTYNDYGCLADIERNENVLFLEEKFGIEIEDIFSDNENFKASGMFIHRDIWDIMVEKQMNEFGEEISDKKGDSGYYGNYGDEYYLKEFNILRASLKLQAEIDEQLEDKDLSKEEYQKLAIKRMRLGFDSKVEYNIFKFRHYVHFTGNSENEEIWGNVKDGFYDLYKEKIQNGDMFEELLALKKFEISMTNCNNIYFPTANGAQFGNPWANKVVVEKTLEILNAEIKEREEFEDE